MTPTPIANVSRAKLVNLIVKWFPFLLLNIYGTVVKVCVVRDDPQPICTFFTSGCPICINFASTVYTVIMAPLIESVIYSSGRNDDFVRSW